MPAPTSADEVEMSQSEFAKTLAEEKRVEFFAEAFHSAAIQCPQIYWTAATPEHKQRVRNLVADFMRKVIKDDRESVIKSLLDIATNETEIAANRIAAAELYLRSR
jgi:hypothetical protein